MVCVQFVVCSRARATYKLLFFSFTKNTGITMLPALKRVATNAYYHDYIHMIHAVIQWSLQFKTPSYKESPQLLGQIYCDATHIFSV